MFKDNGDLKAKWEIARPRGLSVLGRSNITGRGYYNFKET